MQAYKFVCPSCRKITRIHEICLCDGVMSEIHGFVDEGNLEVDEPEPVWDCEYIDAIGYGDVDSVFWQCAKCGAMINAECLEDLVGLEYIELYDHLPVPNRQEIGNTEMTPEELAEKQRLTDEKRSET